MGFSAWIAAAVSPRAAFDQAISSGVMKLLKPLSGSVASSASVRAYWPLLAACTAVTRVAIWILICCSLSRSASVAASAMRPSLAIRLNVRRSNSGFSGAKASARA